MNIRVWLPLATSCLFLSVGCGGEVGPPTPDSVATSDSALGSPPNHCQQVLDVCTRRISALTRTIERLTNTLSDPSDHPGLANLQDRDAQLKVECAEKITEACG